MLSKDEITDGMTFILKLWDQNAVASQWVETFQGETAEHWYDINCRSDWNALRTEAGAVFNHAVSEEQAETVRNGHDRCIYIHTTEVRANELVEVTTTGGQR